MDLAIDGRLSITEDQWLDAFQLNFHAARRLSKAVIPALLESGAGSLVHVASESGRLPSVRNTYYAAAKLPLLSMSKALAIEFTPQGLRSNVVTPGMTRTPLYERPGGFGDQIAQALGTDRETAINTIVSMLSPLLIGKIGHHFELLLRQIRTRCNAHALLR